MSLNKYGPDIGKSIIKNNTLYNTQKEKKWFRFSYLVEKRRVSPPSLSPGSHKLFKSPKASFKTGVPAQI